ncbi:hypothetical protein L6452_19854 [Arctium lappa]|uniref:Uncharacterized protein n=1 Tax=Arctium lappa TaxID=4217 RepID=A0ACB9B9B3_ARCLA|nr:hypothetical protein L6452_19854 [Arctium lappa]
MADQNRYEDDGAPNERVAVDDQQIGNGAGDMQPRNDHQEPTAIEEPIPVEAPEAKIENPNHIPEQIPDFWFGTEQTMNDHSFTTKQTMKHHAFRTEQT